MSWLSKAVKGVTSFLGGPIGSAALGVVDTLFSNSSNEKAVQMQNEANAALWREQAEYNTPANQVARLRAAGLNPNLFYSQGNTGNMTSAPTMQANRYNYNFAQAVDKAALVYQMRNLKEQNENLAATTGKLEAEKGAIKENTRKTKIEADYREAVLNFYKKYGRFPDQDWRTSLISIFQDKISGSSSSDKMANMIVDYLLGLGRDYSGMETKVFKPFEKYDYLRSRR